MRATQTSFTITNHFSAKPLMGSLCTAFVLCGGLMMATGSAHAQKSFNRIGQHGTVNTSSTVRGNTVSGQAEASNNRGGNANAEGSAT